MMTIVQLEYALAVDKHRNFHKAAQSCHVTQPTLSMQLKKLEDELGFILFDRSKNPMLKTPEGEQFLDRAGEVVKAYRGLGQFAEQIHGEAQGTLRVGIIPTLSPYLTPIFIKRFGQEYPKIELLLEEFKTEEILRLLERDELDAGILVTPLDSDHFIARSLYYEQFCVFAHRDHSLLKKKKVKGGSLGVEDIWLLKEGHCFRNQVLNICGANLTSPISSFESGSLETLKNLVLEYGGYTLLPETAVHRLSSDQKELVRYFSGPVPLREVSIITSRIFYKEKLVDALEETIIESLPNYVRSHKNKREEIIEIF
jgi:LysR family hydrogen peroxide-inducible transcriptional activator